MNKDMPVNVTSGFGAQKRVPYVQLQIGEISIQLEPESARSIAFMLLEAAEAADTDAMVMRVVGPEDESTAIQLLRLFRQYRVESRQEKDHVD